ncbi:unnamed protein product [Mytilus coruscus]|uniref:Uncharacterized protein n=1 Tax=Mytilus coruscus TaxID=42192 RepID=A0A6J8ASL2_MYTCO|nr:unnamed protein product [Mytilus coruscus]
MNILCHTFWIPILHVLSGKHASAIVKHINITTPEGYGGIELSDYCIKPTDEFIQFEAMASDDVWVSLFTDIGITGPGYQIDNLLESSEYRQFWISWRDGILEVGRGLSVHNTLSRFIVWPDPEPLNITGLVLSSHKEGSCIIHYPTGNTVKYTKVSGKRGASVLLSNIVGHHVVECAVRCRLEPECINFNFKEFSKMCELLQARLSEATDDSFYNFYSHC